MKKLLIPVDFSETSDAAVNFGLQLADKCGYHVMFQHSVDFMQTYESMYMDAPHVQSFTQQVVEDMEDRLDEMYDKYNKEGLSISKHLTTGSLIQDIKKLVWENEIDLIIMGTRGASGFKEFFVGSNTEKIVRLAECPVISVHKQTNLGDIRRILVPVDLDEIRPSFLKEISMLQQIFSASVEFCWVKTPHDIENLSTLEEEFNNLINEYEIASSTFTVIRNVFPQDGLLLYSQKSDVDMLAMATHARRGLAHWFSGSLTEDVMNHSQVPLWSFKINPDEKPIDLENFQDLSSLVTE